MELGDILFDTFKSDRKYRDDIVKPRWDDADKFFFGKQSRFKKTPSAKAAWKANTVTNHIYAYYQSALAVLMRDLPSVRASARYPSDDLDRIAKWLSPEITSIMRQNEFAEREEELIFSFFNYCRGYLKVTWDGRLNGGTGGIRIDTVHAKNMVPQPGVLRIRDCNRMHEIHSIDKLSLLRMYPDYKDHLLKQFSRGKDISPEKNTSNESERGTHTTGTGMTTWNDAAAIGNLSDMVEIVETWVTDEETIKKLGLLMEVEDGKAAYRKRERSFKKYPTGRMVRFCGDVILEDAPNPFPTFPYSECVNMSDNNEWPMSELDQLIPIQKAFDTRKNQLFDALNHSVTGDKVLVDGTLGINIDEMNNDPAKRFIPCRDAKGAVPLPGPRIPGEAFLSLDKEQAQFDRISGYPEAIIQSASSQRSGYTVEQLTDLAQGRMKLKSYSIEATIRDMARQITGMVALFYQPGIHVPFDLDISGIAPDMFDFSVRAGSNLPASRAIQQQQILSYYDRGLVDELYVVEHSDLDDTEEIISRLSPVWDAKKQMAMQAPPQRPNLQVVGG